MTMTPGARFPNPIRSPLTFKMKCYVNDREFECDSYRWVERDARGIELGYVCEKCRSAKLSRYRPEVLSDPHYAHDEPIEPDQSPHTFDVD